ncbi:hypothetical protein HCN44_004337 [Aphidius gifuensis]|uniref:Uncharacterized protein n=1 Tax=Aphidius gifuensis TaxID=684658 RepID=A0A835CVX4_APHGI|nr:protein abrupt-like [Aphidius gifuensis]KAF7994865.1 hypothetical protein HCN44_004337 [Aphidius gifuensis]
MAGEQFSLVWNSFPTNLSSGLYSLLTDEHLVDVTLAAEGKILRAHKLILSVCSTYFRDLFKGNTCKHPIVILKDVNYSDLLAMLHFMYQGEVNIKQEDISSFLKVAETLQIKGLTRDTNQNKNNKQDELNTVRLDDEIKSEKESDVDKDIDVDDEQDEEELVIEKLNKQLSNIQDNNESQKVDVDDDASTSSSITFHNENYSDNKINTQLLLNDNNMNIENLKNTNNQASNLTTTTNNNIDNNDDNDKPLDYRFVMTQSTSKNLNTNENNQVQSPQESASYHSDYHEEPSDINQAQNCEDNLECQLSRAPKGRRTVKGIAHSTLPLETTLRVVSELGPTLRVDRGKVVRMYSCPWCLRQFTRKENLKLHVKYLHGPLESLTCKLCGNKYKNSNSLRVHSYLYHNTKRNKHNNSLVASHT